MGSNNSNNYSQAANILSQLLATNAAASASNKITNVGAPYQTPMSNNPNPPPFNHPPGIGTIPETYGLPDAGEMFEVIIDWVARLMPVRENKALGSQHGWVLMSNSYYHGYQQGYAAFNAGVPQTSTGVTTITTGIVSGNGFVNLNTLSGTVMTTANNNPIYINGTMWTGPNGTVTDRAGILIPVGTMIHLESIVLRNKTVRTSRVKLKLKLNGRNYKVIVPLDSFNELHAIRHPQPF